MNLKCSQNTLNSVILSQASYTSPEFFRGFFIDGTVEGRPNDLRVYIDTNVTHDHTYYGNGCGPDIGSTTPCSTRIVQTNDGENQKNGTYYHFQAATVGTGGTIASENANSPDTFCPLGWQLPYSGTGGDYYDISRSIKVLLDTYQIDDNITGVHILRSYPFSIVYSGYFDGPEGSLNNKGVAFNMLSSIILNRIEFQRFSIYGETVNYLGMNNKNRAQTVRCV